MSFGRRSRFVTTVRVIEGTSHSDVPRPQPVSAERAPVGRINGDHYATSLHFTTQHFYGVPDINPAEHKFMIHAWSIGRWCSLMNSKRFPSVSHIHFLQCVGSRPSPNGKTVSAARAYGLQRVDGRAALSIAAGGRAQERRDMAHRRGSDGGKHRRASHSPRRWTMCWWHGQNGEPIRPDHGYPLRLIVPGFEGIYNVKWLRRLKVVDQPYLTFQEHSRFLGSNPRTQPDTYDFGPSSVITYPSGSHQLTNRGTQVISGLAWSGGGTGCAE
jgi:sulfane dehydrogenase subunit SoxC